MDRDDLPKRLVDYLVLVGPGAVDPMSPRRRSSSKSEYQDSAITPKIFNRFPAADHKDYELSCDVAYFCQPEGHTRYFIDEPKTHVFMLTNTVTNTKTYGVCLSLPHLFDPLSKCNGSVNDPSDSVESFIQEWGVLSICLLSKHPFFNFFTQSLITLTHFVQDFGETEPLWAELLNHKPSSLDSPLISSRRQRMLAEILSWIEQLLTLEAPEPGSALEVELEVNPALLLAYPSATRLPLFDLSVHEVFKRLDVCTVIEIFKLVFSEHKVIVHSSDGSFASECVLTVSTLLYPVQYLYPLIPLLPTSMPTAENLLGVPTPFYIGVCSSFLRNVHETHLAEVWVVDLDKKEITAPSRLDQPVLEFPYSILQLQADVRLALDKLEDAEKTTPIGNHVINSSGHVTSTPVNPTHLLSQAALKLSSPDSVKQTPPPELHPHVEDSYRKHLENDVDVMIRVAFVEFLFSVDILGLIDQFLCIYRLFPRPVVTIRKSAFLSAYEKANTTVDPHFMRDLMSTQGVEYFYEWSLNPPNSAYEEVRRGVNEVSRVSDKHFHYIHRQAFKTRQVCLYHQSPDSLLYQEMLVYKATQTVPLHSSIDAQLPDEDSDWEPVARGDYYDGDTESSYSTDNDLLRESSSSPFRIIGQGAVAVGGVVSKKGEELMDEVEVGYYSTRKVNSSVPQVVIQRQSSLPSTHLLPQTGQKIPRPKSMVTTDTNPVPRLDVVRRSISFEDLSVAEKGHSNGFSHLGDQSTAYLTSTEYLTAHQFDTDGRTSDYSAYSSCTSEEDVHQLSQEGCVVKKDLLSPHRTHNNTLRDSLESSGSEHVDFATPGSTLPRQRLDSFGDEGGGSQVARTVLALSALNNSRTMDNQIMEIVGKVVGGQGLPWPKPAALKRLAMYEKTRVLILRHLEEKLGVRTSNDVVMATSAQVAPVGATRAVYRGVLDLLKLLLHSIEEEFLKEPETPIFSVFLILRVAFSVYHEPKAKATLGFSLRSALSIGTSLLATEAAREPMSPQDSPSQVTENKSPGDPSRTQPLAGRTSNKSTPSTTSLHNGHTPKSSSQISLTSTPRGGSESPPHTGSFSSLSLTPELASKQDRLSTIAKQDDLLNQLVNSPRFYHPREGQDVRSFNFLYKELLKGQGTVRPFLVKKEFWSNVFMSTVDTDRGYLGWNERTADLYHRYNSLPEVHRRTFGSEEDHLLSIVAHNLLVYMLMVGLSPKETMLLINNFTARTRLATFEEKLLQQTIRYVEKNASNEIDLSYLGLMALYSEIHPTISHIIHYGVNMIAPVYKLQITDEALILRRFPDERISVRLWNDRITVIERNETRATVSVRYRDHHGEFSHHFHTKEYQKVYQSLRALVHVVGERQPHKPHSTS